MQMNNVSAMILAAGMGTRMKPITDNKPKALVTVNGKTLLELAIQKLKFAGVNNIVINVHHFADMIIEYLQKNNNFGVNIIISNERDELLNTGGGIKKAEEYLSKSADFFVYNVDVISDIDLNTMYCKHKEYGCIGTLAVKKRSTSRYFLFDEQLNLCGWENTKNKDVFINREFENHLYEYAFSGIHCLKSAVFKYIIQTGAFSIVDAYMDLCREHQFKAYLHTEAWYDIGKFNELINENIFEIA